MIRRFEYGPRMVGNRVEPGVRPLLKKLAGNKRRF
jgi:hypothetical protein